jgi:hypothetical protein
LSIPSKFVISKLNPEVSSYCLNNKISLEPDYDCLIAFLNNEKKKKNSLFKDYFKTLPQDFSTFPVNFNHEEKELLKNSFLFKRLKKFEKDVNKTYKSLKNSGQDLKYPEFLSIYLLIQSRSFGLDTPEKTIDALVPFADMFNTSLNPKPCFWYFDDENNFKAQATRIIQKGEEINIRYNEGYNTDFLLYYGFTIGDNNNGHIYDFEVKIKENNLDLNQKEENETSFLIDLNINPSLKHLNIQRFRKKYYLLNELNEQINQNSKILSCQTEDVEIFKILKKEILQNLEKYPSEPLNIQEKFVKSINQINIQRVLEEEKKVLQRNLSYLNILIESFETKNFEELYENFEIKNYYDIEYLNSCKKLI